MKLRDEIRRFAVFNTVGILTTAVGIPLMALLDRFGVPYAAYTALNYLSGIVLGFWLNFRYTFRQGKGSLAVALGRYLLCFVTLLGAVQAFQFALIDMAGWPRWTGVGAGMLFYGGLGYLLSRWWVFGKPASAGRKSSHQRTIKGEHGSPARAFSDNQEAIDKIQPSLAE